MKTLFFAPTVRRDGSITYVAKTTVGGETVFIYHSESGMFCYDSLEDSKKDTPNGVPIFYAVGLEPLLPEIALMAQMKKLGLS